MVDATIFRVKGECNIILSVWKGVSFIIMHFQSTDICTRCFYALRVVAAHFRGFDNNFFLVYIITNMLKKKYRVLVER